MSKDFECPDCEYYEVGMQHFHNVQAILNKYKMVYKGQDFNFCPWCGAKLQRHKAEVQPDDRKLKKAKRRSKK